jgi:hypothetical protein
MTASNITRRGMVAGVAAGAGLAAAGGPGEIVGRATAQSMTTPPDTHFWDWDIYDWLDIGAKGAGSWLAGFAIQQLLGDPEFSKIQNAIDAAVKEIEDYIATAFLQDALRKATVGLNSVILGLSPYSDPNKPISPTGLTDVESARRDAEYAIADSQSLGISGLAIFANCISYHFDFLFNDL